MLYAGTDPESYITESTLAYEDYFRIAHLTVRYFLGYRAWGIWVWDLRLGGWVVECRVPGFEFRVSCFVF